LLDDPSPMGLSSFKTMLTDNYFMVQEVHVNQLNELKQPHDLVIFYKLSPNIMLELPKLNQWYLQIKSSIVFGHPKYAGISNALIKNPNIQFTSTVIEDAHSPLMQSKSQLMVTTTSPSSLVGIFPFSSAINYTPTNNIQPIAVSQSSAFITSDNGRIQGPFVIAVQRTTPLQSLINNYLIITNYWIHQADNAIILKNLIQTHLNQLPVLIDRITTNDGIILTPSNALKLLLILIILPVFAILLICIATHQKNNRL
jgi:hypothetical protein